MTDDGWSGFAEWAEAQFGPRPKSPSYREVLELEYQAKVARQAYEAGQLWDRRVNAALYAWQVRDEKKCCKSPRGYEEEDV